MKLRWLHCILWFNGAVLFGYQPSVIAKFNKPVKAASDLGGLPVHVLDKIPGHNIYKLSVDRSKNINSVMSQLHSVSSVQYCEPNQIASIDSPVPAVEIDQRPIFILDQRPIFILDSGSLSGQTSVYGQAFLDQINARNAWQLSMGAGVTVAVVDTGMDLAHPLLAGGIAPGGFDFVDWDDDPSEARSDLDSNQNGYFDEGWGHGSHIAGIVRLVAPEVELLPIRVVDSDGQADLFTVLLGLEHALSNGAQVVNLSLSIPEPSQLLEDWINEARAMNVLVTTSAGNKNTAQLDFPANETLALTVASVTAENVKSSFSNYSYQIDVAAPGEDIVSCLPGGDYVARSGTSMSAPMAAGQAALIWSTNAGTSVFAVQSLIKTFTQNLDSLNPDYSRQLGRGLIDVEASVLGW